MVSISRYIEENLKIKVNKDKSKVDRPWKRTFLGFSYYVVGMKPYFAKIYANARKGYWHISNSNILSTTLTNKYLKDIALISLSAQYSKMH